MEFDIKTLGGLQVKSNGKIIKFPYKKVAVLFIYLIIKKQVSRDEIANLLWENAYESEIRKNLRNALYNLRRVTAKDIVVTNDNENIILNTSDFTFNVDYLKIIESNNEEEIISLYDIFLKNNSLNDLYVYDEWVSEQRERLLEIYLHACNNQVNLLLSEKRYEDALLLLKKKIKHQEYDEVSYRNIMSIYFEKKDYNSAINVYQKLIRLLDHDLGVKCEKETTNLYEMIVNTKLLVNKDGELKNIGQKVEQYIVEMYNSYRIFESEGKGAQFLITGNAGVGKSHLVEQFIAGINQNIPIIITNCFVNDKEYIYKSIAPLIDELAKKYKTIGFNKLLSYATKESNTSQNTLTRYQHFDDYAIKLFKKILEQNKLVIIIDSIHYMDNYSFKLIKKILSEQFDNLYFIATCRCHTERHNTSECLLNEMSDIKKYRLINWNSNEVAAFLKRKLMYDDIDDSYLTEVMNRTAGNPYLLKHCIDVDGKIIFDDKSMFSKIYNNLSDVEKKIINLLSIFEREVIFDDLQSVLAMNDIDLIERLHKLEEKEIIKSLKSDQGYKYRIVGGMFRDYIYNNLDDRIKKQLHNVVGKNIESNNINIVSSLFLYKTLIEHFKAADNKVKELEYLVKYNSIKNYCQCELFSIIEISLVDTLSIKDEENYEEILEGLEREISYLSDDLISDNNFQAIIALYYMMKARYYLKIQKNDEAYESISAMMTYSNKLKEPTYYSNTNYLMIYYAINTNNTDLLKSTILQIKSSLNNLDSFSIEYVKALVTYYRFNGYYYALIGDLQRAKEQYEDAISVLENSLFNINSVYAASLYHYYAQLAILRKDYTQAIEQFEKCLSLLEKDNLLIDAILISKGYLSIAYYLNDELDQARSIGQDFYDNYSKMSFNLKNSLFDNYLNFIVNDKELELDNLELDNSCDLNIVKQVIEKTIV